MLKMKRVAMMLAAIMCISAFSVAPVMAAQLVNVENPKHVNEKDIEILPDDALTGTVVSVPDKPTPRFINDFLSRKTDVTHSYEWSGYKRVSDYAHFGAKGGSVSVNKGLSFGVVVAGVIEGLSISTAVNFFTQEGLTFNVGPYESVYVGAHVQYDVEEGIREQYDVISGKIISRNPYTVRTPIKLEYELVNY